MLANYFFRHLLILLFLFNYHLFANSIDSLESVLENSSDDSIKTETCISLLSQYYSQKKYDSAIVWGNNAKKYGLIVGDTNVLIRIYRSLGFLYKLEHNYSKAIESFLSARQFFESQKDFKSYSQITMSIAAVYFELENYLICRKYYYEALEGYELIGYQYQKAGVLLSIGIIQIKANDYISAKTCFFSALDIYEEKKVKKSHPESIKALQNIGFAYLGQDSIVKALSYFNKAEQRVDKEKQANLYADILNNIGHIYVNKKFYTQAKIYFKKSLDIGITKGLDKIIVINNIDLATIEFIAGNIKLAEQHLKEILNNVFFIKRNEKKIEAYKLLSKIYEVGEDYKNAHNYNLLHLASKDAIKSEEIEKRILQDRLEREFQAEIELQKKEVELKEERIRLQNIVGWSMALGLLVLMVLSVFIFINYKNQKAAKLLISEQKGSLEELHEEQTSSIRYAKKIQDAILPSQESLSKILPEHFVFYLPRDIVSGDFYWAHQTKDGHNVFAVADCTGHGVPGAFMSMIGHSLLNETIISKGILNPARVLNNMRSMIISSLHQKGEQGEARDGMDMALCIISPDNKKLNFAGAFNSLYLIRDNELIEIKADKQPVGYYSDDQLYFTNREIDLNSNDRLYVFSDGFPDQFGGPKGKKYMYGKFKRFLIQIHQKPMEEQNLLLKNEFQAWLGQEPQVDDVCIIGLKV